MESIIQDLGEIPDEYLEPAGDGGYNTDPENDETANEHKIQILISLMMSGTMQDKNIAKTGVN